MVNSFVSSAFDSAKLRHAAAALGTKSTQRPVTSRNVPQLPVTSSNVPQPPVGAAARAGRPFLQKYGKAKRSEINKLLGSHISDKQFRNFIDELKTKGLIRTERERGQMTYSLGDNYNAQNALINKAIE